MDFLIDIARSIAHLVRPYLQEVSFAMVASVVFIYGEDLNALLKKQIQPYHVLVRILIFIVVCAFGYGALTVFLAMALERVLDGMDSVSLVLLLLGFILAIGLMAERRKQI